MYISKKKTLDVQIEFRTLKQLSEAMTKIRELTRSGINSYKESSVNHDFEFNIEFEPSDNFREEVFDDKLCHVYQSVMNQKECLCEVGHPYQSAVCPIHEKSLLDR